MPHSSPPLSDRHSEVTKNQEKPSTYTARLRKHQAAAVPRRLDEREGAVMQNGTNRQALARPSYLSLAVVTCSPNRVLPELACPLS